MARCLTAVVLSSAGLFTLFAVTGEGPVVAVKERRTIVLGATGELPVGVVPGRRLATLERLDAIAR